MILGTHKLKERFILIQFPEVLVPSQLTSRQGSMAEGDRRGEAACGMAAGSRDREIKTGGGR